jgi:hypothetical protein
MPSNSDIRKRHGAMKDRRRKEEPQWREIAELLRPECADIGTQGAKRTRIADDIFDSTPLQALEQYVGGLFSQSTNPADRWFELGISDDDLKAWGPVKDYLWNYTQLVYSSFSPAVSAFYAMVPSSYADLGAFGLGSGYSDLPQGANRFTDVCVPLDETYVETDQMGFLTRFHREFCWKGEMLKREFGEAAEALDEARDYSIIHAVFENEDYTPGRIGPKGMRWASVYCCADNTSDNFRVEKGYYEMPYWSIPWTLRPGRYPSGPGHLSRADVNMLNEMERSHIVAGQFAAEGLYIGWDESTITAADIVPGRVLHGGLNENGKQLLQRVELGNDLRLSMAQSEQRRSAIREAFLFSIMQLVNRPQMTATEFLGFKEEQLRLMGPNLGRIHSYGLSPLIARRARLLARAGMVPPPPRELAGHSIEVSFTSPLAKAQKAAQARAILQVGNQVIMWGQANPAALDKFNFDKATDYLADGYGVMPGVINTDDQVAALRQARAQQQQQQVAVEQGAQLSKIYADVAHANQAQTRSQQRTENVA